MSTIRETIMAAVVTALGGITGCPVERSRVAAISRAQTPFLVVRLIDEADQQFSDTDTRHDLTIALELFVRGEIPDQIADPYIQSAHAKLMADPTLGGKCHWIISDGTKWEMDDADHASAMITLSYKIIYTSIFTDLTRAY